MALERRNILIVSAGRRVKLLEGFKAAVERLIPGSLVIAADYEPTLSSACAAADLAVPLPKVTDSKYVPALRDICTRNSIGLVIPTIDTELKVLAAVRDQFADVGTSILISDSNVISECADKRKTQHVFERFDISFPRIFDHSSIEFPCFTKPAFGSSSVGAMRIDHPSQLTADLLQDSDRIFMQYVSADYREVTVDLYYDRHSALRCVVPRYRIATRAGEVSKGVTRKGFVYRTLVKKLGVFPGARGCLTLQLFISPDDQSMMAIEINARFGGGFPLSLEAGADFPAWAVAEWLCGTDVAFYDGWQSDLLMLRYDDHKLVRNYAQ